MFNPLKLMFMAALIFTSSAFAESCEVANEPEQQYEVASYEFAPQSFFEPKSEADIKALATPDGDLEQSLGQDTPN